RLAGAGTVEVAPDGQKLAAKNVIIATGARPRSIPPLPVDGEKVITSRESIVLDQLPSSIVIVGGGAIGVEFAYLYRMYGVEVTVVELLPRLVPAEDEDISPVLERSFTRHGINVMTGASVSGIENGPNGVTVRVEKDGEDHSLICDKVLVAIGVQPNSEDLGLEGLGIAVQAGYIQIDDSMATNVPGVYAVGDVTGKLALAHAASAQAVAAVEHIAGIETQPLDYVSMPRATYCNPQIASFGLTEAQAREQGHEINIGTFSVQANGKALAMGESEGMVKLVVDAKYGELLGGHMIGPEVTELLGELAVAKLLEGTTLELGWAVHPHPSLSEMLKEAALSAQGKVIHM
ncbi:MAG: dihydrolipoyl dehydrogenase, partial [Chloroflexi bacterium]|nr:dihydrolipoyl dehydrogenase [Chloroflexota bacterium]